MTIDHNLQAAFQLQENSSKIPIIVQMRISRYARMVRFLKTGTRQFWNDHPLSAFATVVYGIPATIVFAYKLCKYGVEIQPYYRYRYDIVRPDDPIALNWRVPEDYPAHYLSNRECVDYTTRKKDYGWKADI